VGARFALGLVVLSVVAACGPGAPTLYVDVRSDLLAGTEVDAARVELLRGDDPTPFRTTTEALNTVHDLFAGTRVAEFGDLEKGRHLVRVEMLFGGAVVVRSTAAVMVEGDTAITLVLTRSCGTVSCPGLGDDAGALACLAGRCVPPDCVPEGAAACGVSDCSTDDECPSSPGCSPSRCVDGVCFVPSAATSCVDGGPRIDGGPRTDAGPVHDGHVPVPDGGGLDAGRPDPLSPDLVLFYPFDAMDLDTIAYDHVGDLDIACSDPSSCPPRRSEPGRVYRDFRGGDWLERAAAGIPVPTTAITVSAWVYIPDALGSSSYVIAEKARSGEPTWVLEAIGGMRLGFSVRTSDGFSQAISGTASPTDTWIHVAGRLEAERVAVFIDGSNEASTYAYGSLVYDGRELMIGASRSESAGTSSHFEGFIDDVRVYDVALSSAQIADLALAGPE
jgi:hypothetical protein